MIGSISADQNFTTVVFVLLSPAGGVRDRTELVAWTHACACADKLTYTQVAAWMKAIDYTELDKLGADILHTNEKHGAWYKEVKKGATFMYV